MELGHDDERNEGMSERDYLNQGYRADQPMETRSAPTERDFLNEGYRASQPMEPRIDVVVPRAQAAVRQLVAAGQRHDTAVALAPVEMAPAFVGPPENLFPDTIIPLRLRAPTARLVSTNGGTGAGMPWTTGPPSLVMASTALGALIISVGRHVVAQIAIAGLESLLGRAKKKYNRPNVKFRYLTNETAESVAGNIVRPRGADGSVPEGMNPYENPDDFSIFRPWTWF